MGQLFAVEVIYRGVFQKTLAKNITRDIVLAAHNQGKLGISFGRYGDAPERNGIPAKSFAIVANDEQTNRRSRATSAPAGTKTSPEPRPSGAAAVRFSSLNSPGRLPSARMSNTKSPLPRACTRPACCLSTPDLPDPRPRRVHRAPRARLIYRFPWTSQFIVSVIA